MYGDRVQRGKDYGAGLTSAGPKLQALVYDCAGKQWSGCGASRNYQVDFYFLFFRLLFTVARRALIPSVA